MHRPAPATQIALTLLVIGIAAGCSPGASNAGVPSPATVNTTPPAARLVIRKADYGDLANGLVLDVTDKVRAMVKDGKLSVAATDAVFGDPYKGKMKLKIVRADILEPGLNLGGEGGAGDVTSTIKGFQQGNTLVTKMTGDGKVTVYYKYGNGETQSMQQGQDGWLKVTPPTKLRVDYTFDGSDKSKTVGLNDTLLIDDKGQ